MRKIKNFKKHFNNFLLLILSSGFFWLGASFLEYEISKKQHAKELIWVKTTPLLTYFTTSAMILGSILIISMLVLIYLKKLENRQWLWGVIFIQALALILLSVTLGYNRFIWILFPNTFHIF